MPQPHPGIWPIVLLVCVVVVALPALWIKLQNDRQRFTLLKMAIEKGMTSLPLGLPIWLVSLRQGVLVFVAGFAPLIIGGFTLRMAGTIPAVRGTPNIGKATISHIANPPTAATQPKSVQGSPSGRSTPPMAGNPGLISAPQWNGPDRGAGGWPGGMRPGSGPGNSPWPNRPGMRPHPGRRFGPPIFIRRAHEVMVRQNAGLALLGVGLVLCLLGLVRIAFAFLERRYTTDRPATG